MAAVKDGTDQKKTGKCPVCGGNIMEKVDIKENDRQHFMKPEGLYCTKCGIKFEFSPPDGVALKK